MAAVISKAVLDPRIAEARKVFDAHKEAKDATMQKKLIINIAPSGSFINRTHNPYLPLSAKEMGKELSGAYNEGATMWHFHPKDPETETTGMPVERRVAIHKEWCDSVFDVAPDIITDVGGIYVLPPTFQGAMIEEVSILAEKRVAPLIDRLIQLGPANRYVEVGIVLCHTAALGGTNLFSFGNRASISSDVRYLQSRNIRVELSPFKHSDLQDVKDWVFDSGIVETPVIVDTLLGVHNSPRALPGIEGFEQLFAYVRMLPKGVKWQAMIGGRQWLPLTIAAVILGADIVRIGKEDAVFWNPRSDEIIKESGRVVETVAKIARSLGREIASATEARQILSLPQIKGPPARAI